MPKIKKIFFVVFGASAIGMLTILSASAATPSSIQVKTCQDLQNIQNNLSGNYVLVNDIDCATFGGVNGFKPIGSHEKPFTGSLTSGVYKIKNLTIYQPSSLINKPTASLFYAIKGANIHDLVLSNINIQGAGHVALIYETLGQSTISNIVVDGTVGAFNGDVSSGEIDGFIG
ncbi:MAG: ZmpA/ZmpB/ZmpC family metallo-endopeptidase-related protein, partial [Candidatus Omnitrophota bacterium]